MLERDKREAAIFAEIFPRRLTKGDQTKLRIIKTAVDCIGNDGIEHLTFDSLGKRLKMSASQVRYHFNDKGMIVSNVINYVLANLQDTIVAKLKQVPRDWKTQALSTIETFFEWLEANPKQASVLLYFYYASSIDSKYLLLSRRVEVMANSRMEAILQPLGEKKKWSRTKTSEAAETIWATADGYAIYFLVAPDKQDPARHRKRAVKVIKELLDYYER